MVKLPAVWMKSPVADTPNNWIDVKKNNAGKYDAEVGKEWWVADDWGIGLALRLSFAGVSATDSIAKDAGYGAAFVSLLFSATYQ